MKIFNVIQSRSKGILTHLYSKVFIYAFAFVIGSMIFWSCKTESPVSPPVVNPVKLIEGEIINANVTIDLSKSTTGPGISGSWQSVVFIIDRIVLDGKVQPVIKSISFIGDNSIFDKPVEDLLGSSGWESSIRTMLVYLGTNIGLQSSEVSKLSVNKFDAQYAEPLKLSKGRASVVNVSVKFYNNGFVYPVKLNLKDDGKISSFYESLKSVGDSFYADENITKNCFNKFTLPNGNIVFSPKKGTGVNFSFGQGGGSLDGKAFSKSVTATIDDIDKLGN